jgi:hypothetical protein
MPYADWAGVTRDLTAALERLADGEFLIMGEPCLAPGPRRRLFGRQPSPPPTRYVQAMRFEEILSAECVGPTSLGGAWEMTDVTIEQLRGMGWLTPAESRAEFGNVTPNFDTYVELACAHALADLMAASLALLGAQPQTLVLECSEGGSSAVGG